MAIKFGDFVKDDAVEAFERSKLAPVHAAAFYGRLKMWKPERYFGFIERDDGVDVFIHGSTLDAAGIEPVVGVRVAFESATDAQGRQRVSRVWGEPDAAA